MDLKKQSIGCDTRKLVKGISPHIKVDNMKDEAKKKERFLVFKLSHACTSLHIEETESTPRG